MTLERLDPSPPETSEPSWRTRGDADHPSSLGGICSKGARIGDTLAGHRLSQPLYRADRSQPLAPISWDDAMSLLAQRVQDTVARHGPDAFAMYGSGQLHTEDYYVAQRLVKGVLGTNNFDANSRLCMSSAVSAYRRTFGSDGPPCCYEDLDLADLVVVIGSNLATCHPVLFQRLLERRRAGSSTPYIVVIDPRRTRTAARADLHLAPKPGTDGPLLRCLAAQLVADGGIDADFVRDHTTGFETYLSQLRSISRAEVAEACGLSLEAIETLSRRWRGSERVLTLWSMGINQSTNGTAAATEIIHTHLLTGQVGRPGAGPFSLTGQPNAMGGREIGGLVGLLPGYRLVLNDADRAEMEQLWGLASGTMAPHRGLTATQQVEAMARGDVKLWWVVATNPMVSMPSLQALQDAADVCPFIVVSEAYATSETLALANLVLPTRQWSEKAGVMTNSERRVTYCPAFREPPGEARSDWAIFAELGQRLGHHDAFSYADAAAVFTEAAALTAGRLCDYSGLSHQLLRQAGPQQWPFPPGAVPSTESRRLYTDHRFPTPDGRACFAPLPFQGLAEPPTEAFPLVLTTGRIASQWHTMTRTGQSKRLMAAQPVPRLEMHPHDADGLRLTDGDWAEVTSARGQLRVQVEVTDRVAPGMVFLPMHWGASQDVPCEVNRLLHTHHCPESRQPELKACAVRVAPIDPTPPAGRPPSPSGRD